MEKLTLITFRKMFDLLTVEDQTGFLADLNIIERIKTQRDEMIAMSDIEHMLCRCGRELTGYSILSVDGWKVDAPMGDDGDYESDTKNECYLFSIPWSPEEYKDGYMIEYDWTPNTMRACCPSCEPQYPQ